MTASSASAGHRLLRLNQALSTRLRPRLSRSDARLFERYDVVVAERAGQAPSSVIVDVGGGRTCSFRDRLNGRGGLRVVGVDVSEAELAHNAEVDDRRVADVVRELPFADGEVGLVASRTVLEHLPDVDAFIRHSGRVLAPGGSVVHLAPCRYALFAVAARIIPFGVARAVLHRVRPDTVGVVEFPVHYDRCHPSAIAASLLRHGFTDVEIEISYAQSDYFTAFFPAYAACGVYERVVRTLGLSRLASYMLVTARRGDAAAGAPQDRTISIQSTP